MKCSRKVGEIIGRSRTVINYYLAKKNATRSKAVLGKPNKFSPRCARLLVNLARKGNKTARDVMIESGVQASLRTVQRVLFEIENENLGFGHLLKRPKLEPHHAKARFDRSKKHSFVTPDRWRKTVFTDEKRFCLDGLAGTGCFWGDR